VCAFLLLPAIASAAFLRSESHGTHEHSLLSLFLRLPQPGGPSSCIYFPQEQGSPVIPEGIGFEFSDLYVYKLSFRKEAGLSYGTIGVQTVWFYSLQRMQTTNSFIVTLELLV
jgi:hypothetical protein